ncbi:MAG: methylcrotonoyl-CoA carboxylase [Candidatus Marinimicrobia bacterium]|nr:methylcrotonoyl-CoA carboxylase [Candidatus Neomarinimicrobiota bacterium]
MVKIGSDIKKWLNVDIESNINNFSKMISDYNEKVNKILMCGGSVAIDKQHNKGRLTARERIDYLKDSNTSSFELGLFAGYEMYDDYGSPAAGGVITSIVKVSGFDCMVIANDATVKAGAYFEITLKKTLRAQKIALENNIPVIYLVDSAGVFLPLQDQVFPDEAHFGRIFYNNAKLSSYGVPQISAVMGPCIAGGAYLPVMSDKYIIVEGASMFLAGPALVKAAIGQDISQEELGGAHTHTSISGTADYRAKDDIDALDCIKDMIGNINHDNRKMFNKNPVVEPDYDIKDLNKLFNPNNPGQYDMREVISRLVDGSQFYEFKKDYGKTLLCGSARIGGYNVGIVANQRLVIRNQNGGMQLGGVVYSESADKGARFIMNCNQDKVPIIFIHDVNGFMVGKDSEWGGIAKDGAKMVNAVSNSIVPKISLLIGGSYGAGNYAMSGRAYEPRFMYSWPCAKLAVMGGEQAAKTLAQIKISKMSDIDDAEKDRIYNEIKLNYNKQTKAEYGAARMWVDEIIHPDNSREVLIRSLEIINNQSKLPAPRFSVFQC